MYSLIKELVLYGIRTSLIDPSEEIYTRNLLLDLMGGSGDTRNRKRSRRKGSWRRSWRSLRMSLRERA